MFGPNKIGEHKYKITFTHRSKKFQELYKNLTVAIKEKFSLQEYDILFIAGSGTTGVESVISTIKKEIVVIGKEGKFKERWINLSKYYNYERFVRKTKKELFCQLETSVSEVFEKEGCIVDAISSFPYYDIPKNTEVFITCCNKQLGAFPGLAIVGVKKGLWDEFKDDGYFSYINLSLYKEYSLNNQTPTTAPIALFEHLLHEVNKIDLEEHRKHIDLSSDTIVDAVGREHFIGETRCPVLTFKKSSIPIDIAERWDLYGLTNESTDYYQIFTYSHPIDDYKNFAKEVKNESN